jgi:hypothetical protein
MTLAALPDLPVRSYAGHSTGPSSSSEAMAYADAHSITAKVQRTVLNSLAERGKRGMTVSDFRHIYPNLHHGQVSSALSALHLRGHIAMLEEKRNRCHVYVLNTYVNSRNTVARRTNRPKTKIVVEETSETFTLEEDGAVLILGGVVYLREADVRQAHEDEARLAIRTASRVGHRQGHIEGLAATIVLLRSTFHRTSTTNRTAISNVINNLSALVRYLRDPHAERRPLPQTHIDAWVAALTMVEERFKAQAAAATLKESLPEVPPREDTHTDPHGSALGVACTSCGKVHTREEDERRTVLRSSSAVDDRDDG